MHHPPSTNPVSNAQVPSYWLPASLECADLSSEHNVARRKQASNNPSDVFDGADQLDECAEPMGQTAARVRVVEITFI